MSTLVAQPPHSMSTARCSCCGLEIIWTRRRPSLHPRGCPHCLPGRLQPQDTDLLQIIRSPRLRTATAGTPSGMR